MFEVRKKVAQLAPALTAIILLFVFMLTVPFSAYAGKKKKTRRFRRRRRRQ